MAIYVYDQNGNKKAWAGAEDDASLAKLGLSKTAPTAPAGAGGGTPQQPDISGILAGNATAQAGATAQMQALMDSIAQITSAGYYQSLLDKIVKQNMPMYDTGKVEIGKLFDQKATGIDADVERRGLFNSGVASEMQRKNNESEIQELAKLMANIKAMSAQQARDAVAQELQALGLQGNLIGQSSQMAQGNAQMAINAALGLGNLGVSQGQLGVAQQNANTQAKSVENQYNLGLAQVGIDQQRLDESARQFNERIALDKQLRLDDLEQFAKTMNLNWAQLSAQSKAQAADAVYRSSMLALETRKFDSEEALIKAQKEQENLQVSFGAYDYIDKMIKAGASKDELMSAIKPYKSAYGTLYSDLLDTVNSNFRAKTVTQPTGATQPGNILNWSGGH